MNNLLRGVFLFFYVPVLSGCSVFGYTGVEVAPYAVLEQVGDIEVRHYERLVLVTTAMPSGMEEQRDPFYKLFNYISGNNAVTKEIPMTAPVLLAQADDTSQTMSFVLPERFSLETAPVPNDPAVRLETVMDYTVAAITFSGAFDQGSINEHTHILEQWIADHGFTQTGAVIAAGYDPPFTIPFFRRNEVLIPVGNR